MDEEEPRPLALDLHKAYVLVEAVDTRQEVVLHPRRVPLPQFDGWAEKHLRSTDTVVVEATSNTGAPRTAYRGGRSGPDYRPHPSLLERKVRRPGAPLGQTESHRRHLHGPFQCPNTRAFGCP